VETAESGRAKKDYGEERKEKDDHRVKKIGRPQGGKGEAISGVKAAFWKKKILSTRGERGPDQSIRAGRDPGLLQFKKNATRPKLR